MICKTELGQRLFTLSKEILANKPSQSKPVFVLAMGLMTGKDYEWYVQQMGEEVIHTNIEYTYGVLNNKDFSQFAEDDIHACMFLASLLFVGAIHEKKSIATGIANLSADEIEVMIAIMKAFGYEVNVCVLGTGDLGRSWDALTQEQKWQIHTRDSCNKDLVSYAYEDITGMPISTFIEAHQRGEVVITLEYCLGAGEAICR